MRSLKTTYFGLFILFICFSLSANAQIQSGEITYKTREAYSTELLDSLKAKSPMAYGFFAEQNKKVKMGLPFLRFKLRFNQNEATYKSENTMDIDLNSNIEAAELSVRGNGVYYVNLKENIQLHQFEHDDKHWIIQSKLDTINWTIQPETKSIKGYKVQKATATVPLNKIKKGKVTAWFAAELPFQFGPIGISGLPGLILEFEINGSVHYTDQIKLDSKDRKVERPSKGKLVTQQEFDQYLKESLRKIFEEG